MLLSVEPNTKTVNQHVQEIFLGKYVLPEFQRTFVWNNPKVKELWESLYNGFPIGQLMFWGEATIDFPVRALGLEQQEIKLIKEGVRAIVDGQQRLTAIWLVLTGDIKLYFNLEAKQFTYDSRGRNILELDILNNRSYDEALKKNFFFVKVNQIQQEKFASDLHGLNSIFSHTQIPLQIITNTDYSTVVALAP